MKDSDLDPRFAYYKFRLENGLDIPNFGPRLFNRMDPAEKLTQLAGYTQIQNYKSTKYEDGHYQLSFFEDSHWPIQTYKINQEQAAHITSFLASIPEVTSLKIGSCILDNVDNFLLNNPYLKDVSIDICYGPKETYKNSIINLIASLSTCKHLESVALTSSGINDAIFEKIKDSDLFKTTSCQLLLSTPNLSENNVELLAERNLGNLSANEYSPR